jgi:hypothetical protein
VYDNKNSSTSLSKNKVDVFCIILLCSICCSNLNDSVDYDDDDDDGAMNIYQFA